MSYAQQLPPTRRIGGISFVLLLHAGLVYALVSGLGRQAIELIKQPLETKIIQEVKPPPDTPPPPPPKMVAPPPPYVPPPEIPVTAPPPPNAITAVTTVKPAVESAPTQVAPKAEPVRTAPVIDAARSCQPPEYPATSRRLEETGTTILQFLIDVDGSVLDSKIETSSGHQRLDDAAKAGLSRCKFKAGTLDGKPEQSWARLRYVWKLE
jgi:protein TonB